jgi:hypothetical protein
MDLPSTPPKSASELLFGPPAGEEPPTAQRLTIEGGQPSLRGVDPELAVPRMQDPVVEFGKGAVAGGVRILEGVSRLNEWLRAKLPGTWGALPKGPEVMLPHQSFAEPQGLLPILARGAGEAAVSYGVVGKVLGPARATTRAGTVLRGAAAPILAEHLRDPDNRRFRGMVGELILAARPDLPHLKTATADYLATDWEDEEASSRLRATLEAAHLPSGVLPALEAFRILHHVRQAALELTRGDSVEARQRYRQVLEHGLRVVGHRVYQPLIERAIGVISPETSLEEIQALAEQIVADAQARTEELFNAPARCCGPPKNDRPVSPARFPWHRFYVAPCPARGEVAPTPCLTLRTRPKPPLRACARR